MKNKTTKKHKKLQTTGWAVVHGRKIDISDAWQSIYKTKRYALRWGDKVIKVIIKEV